MEALAGVPGVEAVAAANYIPTGGGGRGFIDFPGREGDNIGAGYRVVSEAYFDALDVPLLAGRPFGPSDTEGSERVVVVNRSMADVYWPGEDPLGMQVKARSMEGSSAPWLTVVGVVDDMRQYGFESDAEPDMFVLDRQVPYFTRAMTLVVEGRPGTPGLADLTRSAVQEADPNVAVETVSLEGRLAASTGERRMVLSGLGLFGGASVLLVCLGIYGLMSFAAGERTREMAVRVALGADRVGLIGMMLWSALRVVAAGAAIGLLGAWMFSRLLAAFLVDVSAADPLTYAAAVAVLTLVAVGAALAPSVRAARQDPLEALRSEA